MTGIGVKTKERVEKEKEKSVPQGEKVENATVRFIGEESRSAEYSEQMKGSFLRRGKRKLSQKGEKRKREMEKF